VQRTRNFGITTEIVAEQELDDEQLAELSDVLLASAKGARTERGFSMILDGALTGPLSGDPADRRPRQERMRAGLFTAMPWPAAAAMSPSTSRGGAAVPPTASTSGCR